MFEIGFDELLESAGPGSPTLLETDPLSTCTAAELAGSGVVILGDESMYGDDCLLCGAKYPESDEEFFEDSCVGDTADRLESVDLGLADILDDKGDLRKFPLDFCVRECDGEWSELFLLLIPNDRLSRFFGTCER